MPTARKRATLRRSYLSWDRCCSSGREAGQL